MPRPATGKTALRNLRSHDEVWLPALAKTVADATTVTDVVNDGLREYGSTPPARPFTFAEWPDALPWLEDRYPSWRETAAAITAAAPGLAGEEYLGVALWLALTHRPAGQARPQPQRIMAGYLLLGRAARVAEGGWHDQYPDSRALLLALNSVLAEHLPDAGTAQLPPVPADGRETRTRPAASTAAER